ncbi:hypothetical protein EYF80_000295 [Liparis tanakae]|uniref:Uncharacterized protein n=1 Tax=Liparis tanakae TaxID=230148 RepID=A0A4Z2JKA7_9TELE|nr:hypothetical protein EYF80_000295 [Liparis tanakae]
MLSNLDRDKWWKILDGWDEPVGFRRHVAKREHTPATASGFTAKLNGNDNLKRLPTEWWPEDEEEEENAGPQPSDICRQP